MVLSNALQTFWKKQVDNKNVKAIPFSGNCMLCVNELTKKDEDHSVCNECWKQFKEVI
tara:strand:+ start:990 stop:1163 length:174 start_codon:yes stop_codon:yes gene_type:complete